MAAVGGDILEITYSHPTIGSGSFFPIANQGNTLDIGGFRAVDDPSMISGSGGIIDQINRVRGSLECLVENDMNVRDDLGVAAALAADPVPADWTATHVNGKVYAFSGKPVGDLQADTNTAQFTLKVAYGTAKQIV